MVAGCSRPSPGKVVKPVYTNSLGMEFVVIPAGTFLMGSDKLGTSQPIQRVSISTFKMMTTEVTNAQFEEFKDLKRSPHSPSDDTPILGVKRADVLAFVEWLSKKDGVEYSLPTEAQWEYAARGGLEQKDYPWGNGFSESRANIGGRNYGREKATPVKSYPPNDFGLYDMCGNASEMMLDRYVRYPLKPNLNPSGPVVENDKELPYVVRGVGITEYFPQVWFRSMEFNDMNLPTTGFRLVIRTIE